MMGDEQGQMMGDEQGQAMGDERGQAMGDERGQAMGDERGQVMGDEREEAMGGWGTSRRHTSTMPQRNSTSDCTAVAKHYIRTPTLLAL